jgi:uncharacterized protein
VKLVIEESESVVLQRRIDEDRAVLATSRAATVEVARAALLANPSPAVRDEVDRLLASCLLVEVSVQLLRAARNIASGALRTLDAIHLASALRVEPDEMIAYDRRLLAAAREHGLAVGCPGASIG